ncbi:MAG: hypothetical protein K1X67_04510 [Fimbriimonadaceae bacterium]|nr:hypothetical protein [Fimbriimonadaceae bacterium]
MRRSVPLLVFFAFVLVIGCGGTGAGGGGFTQTGGASGGNTGGLTTGGNTNGGTNTGGATSTNGSDSSGNSSGTDGGTTGANNGTTSAGTDGGTTTAGTDGGTTTTGSTNGSTTSGTDGGTTTAGTDGGTTTTTGSTDGSTTSGTDGGTTTTTGSTSGTTTSGTDGGTTGSTNGSTTGTTGGTSGGGMPDLGPNADMNGARPFPEDNPWNTPIDQEPVDPKSATLIASIGLDEPFHPDFGANWNGGPFGIPYVVVSGSQAKSAVTFDYADESDAGPYPIPPNPPIENGGDRHILMIDRDNWALYELYAAEKTGSQWHAGSGAIWQLDSNALRPPYWTSADAAGLPIFPGLVRFDEVQRGEIAHALRFTAERTRRAFVYPARHYASSDTSANLPPMGMRVRLKASVDISGYSASNQVILRALKKYGMFLADNGSNWFVSGAPDSRWNDDDLNELKSLRGRDFEVVKMGDITVGGRYGRPSERAFPVRGRRS